MRDDDAERTDYGRARDDEQDIVLYEFAHVHDLEDGSMTAFFPSYRSWLNAR